MKHTQPLHALLAVASVFAVTFSGGYAASTVALRSADGLDLQLQGLLAAPRVSTGSVRSAVRRRARRIAPRGVKRSAIVRPPRTRRRASGTGVTQSFKETPKVPIKAFCGDMLVLLGEACDDGNTLNGDGCSSACKIETGYKCTSAQPSECWSTCGDGGIASNE